MGRLTRETRVRGGALTEFAVLLSVMVPLLVSVPMLGKLVDLQQTNVQAARYALWEATVEEGARAPGELRARFYGDPSAPLSSRPEAVGRNALWGPGEGGASETRTASAEGVPDARVEIDAARVAALPYGDPFGHAAAATPGPRLAARAGAAVRSTGGLLEGATGGEWNLTADGLLGGGVRVGVARHEMLLAGRAGRACASAVACLEERAVILVDGWSAAGEAGAERRVRSLVPAAAARRVGDAIALVGHLPVYKDLRELKGALGWVDVTRLPDSERGTRPLLPHRGERR